MNIIHYDNPQYFYLLVLVPVFIVIFLLAEYLRRGALKRFGQPFLLEKLTPWKSWRRPWIRFLMLLLAFSFLSTAAVNPRVGSRLEPRVQQGIELIIALDVSRSMLAEDVRPNRLERSKMAVSRLIDNLGDDQVGLVLFAGTAITQVPVTSDRSAVKLMLRTVNTGSVPVQGTSLSAAIHRAVAAFQQEDLGNKVLILISDGESHDDDPVEAARLAAQKGLTIHTVGIGSREGAPIPIYNNNQMSGFLRDSQGNTVVSRYDENTLRQIAAASGGIFQHGSGVDMGLNRILEEIRSVEKSEFESMVFSEYESRFHYFIALALIFLVLEIFIFERKNKWLEKLKIFG